MKMNIKKVATVLGSALMLGATAGMAAAAAYPAPFVQSGAANVAIVVGSNAANSDILASSAIATGLATTLAAQTATGAASGSSTTATGGDSVKLEKSTNLFNLDEELNTVYSSLDEDELSTVLATGSYMNDDNDDFEYTQKISLGSETLEYFQNSDFNDDKPLIGFEVLEDAQILNYTLDFTPDAAEGGVNFTALETTDLTLLGRTYYVVAADATGVDKAKITLLDTANSAIVSEGETKTITLGSKSYEVGISFIDSSNVILTVNGVTTNKLQEGDVFKVETDLYVAVKNNLYASKDTGVSQVEISIGSGKIVIEDDTEVQINGEDVSDASDYVVTADIDATTGSSSTIDSIKLIWTADEDVFLAPGSDLLMPGFETIKLSMTGFVSPKAESTIVEANDENEVVLKTETTDGSVTLPILYSSTTGNYTGIGKDADDKLVTNTTGTIIFNRSQDNWFVVSGYNGDDYESYVLEVTEIDDADATKNTTTIETVGSGKALSLDVLEADEIGSITFTLNAANPDTEVVRLTMTAPAGWTVSTSSLITKEGLKIQLPVNTLDESLAGALNLSDSTNPTWTMNFTEEDEDGTVNAGTSFTAKIGFNSDLEVEVDDTSLTEIETDDNSDKFARYALSTLATKVSLDKNPDQTKLEVTYAGSESYAEVFVSELAASFTTTEGTTTGATQLGSITVKDTEVSSVSGKNLIVIGGSCINSVAAELLSGAACDAAFTAKTGIKAGEALIKSFTRGDKVALLVAGYNAEDTTKAATYLVNKGANTTVGAALKVTSATEATAITA